MRKQLLSAVVATAAWLLPATAATASHAPAYSLTDIGTLGGAQAQLNIPGSPIADNGTILGTADTTVADADYPNFNPFIVSMPDQTLTQAISYTNGKLTDLGALPGNNSSAVFQVNGAGVGAGMSETGALDPLTGYPVDHAVLFEAGAVIDLGTLPGGYESQALAINDRGQVAGFAQNGIPDPESIFGWGTEVRAFIWQDGAMRDLGTLGGPDATMDTMNASGQITGDSYTTSTPNPVTGVPRTDPFLWTDGRMQDLGTLGGNQSATWWLNDNGEVVGQDNITGDQFFHPFLWDGERMRDLGTFGGNFGNAYYVNDAGEIVGWATTPGDATAHAFLWRNGTMTDLTGASSSDCTVAYRINSSDQIVGSNCPETDALVWLHGNQYELNSLIPPTDEQLTSAVSINDRGQIVALGTLPNGTQHIFLLQPTSRQTASSSPNYEIARQTTNAAAATVSRFRQRTRWTLADGLGVQQRLSTPHP